MNNRQFIAAHRARQASLNPQLSALNSPVKSSRLKAPSLTTRLEFERCVDDLTRTTVAIRNLEARRDEEIQRVRVEWQRSIAEAEARVKTLTLIAEKFATEHRDELFPGKEKSAQTTLATYGFRLGNQQLKTLSRVTWEKVLAELDRRRFRRWIRVKKEVAKDAMLAAAKRSTRTLAVLLELGVKVVQEETFFVEPKDKPAAAPEAKAS